MNFPNFNDYQIKLSKGSHKTPQDGMCIMECAAYISGERHTAMPNCSSRLIANLAMDTNDNATDEDRNKLIPFVLRIAGSKGTPEMEKLRALMCIRFMLQKVIPLSLSVNDIRDLPCNTSDDVLKIRTALTIKFAGLSVLDKEYLIDIMCAVDVYTSADYSRAGGRAAMGIMTLETRQVVSRETGFKLRCELMDSLLKLTDPIEAGPALPKLQELVAITA